MTVDYDTFDPLVRQDSYQDVSSLDTGEVHFKVLHHELIILLLFLSLSCPVVLYSCGGLDTSYMKTQSIKGDE